MTLWETAMVAVALGCDAFAVGLGVGTRCCSPRQVFRLSFHFGLFQFLMPLVGWMLGRYLLEWLHQWGPWIACALLSFIGLRMVRESLKPAEDSRQCADPTRGFSLVMLACATSIDALGVGFSLGILGQQLLLAAVFIGITAGVMTWPAMKLGNRLSQRFGRRMGIVGGLVLLVIAVKILAL